MADIFIIGVGNILRGDDAAGPAAAQMLREMSLPGVKVLEVEGDLTGLWEEWQHSSQVIVIDAVASGAVPGTIFRFAAHERPVPREMFAACSSHAFGVAQQIELARSLNQLPPCLIVFGIEGQDFALGSRLSAEVEQALPRVVEQVRQELGLSGPA